MSDKKKICAWCHYARMKTDICGIYCTGGFENPDGTCDHFRDSREGLTERTVSMEHDKLIEALRCCGNRDYKKPDCDHCPLLKTHMCVKVMLESAAAALEDRNAMISENATLRAQLAEKDKQLAAADICDGCNYKNTVGCHCARAKWRGPQEAEAALDGGGEGG